MESKLIKIGGLWVKKKQDGTTFLSGNLGLAVIFVFKNEKRKDTDPDYTMVLGEGKPKPKPEENRQVPDDDIPF